MASVIFSHFFPEDNRIVVAFFRDNEFFQITKSFIVVFSTGAENEVFRECP